MKDMSAREIDHFKKKLQTLFGDESEEDAFINFSKVLKQSKYDILGLVIFNGVEFLFPGENFNGELKGEFDYIILSAALRLIIYVELKGTFSKIHALKKLQFQHFCQYVVDLFPVGDEWSLITAYGFSTESKSSPCPDCDKFILKVDSEKSIQTWWDNILEEVKSKVFDTDGLVNIVSLLTFCARRSNRDNPLTPEEAAKGLYHVIQTQVGSEETILLYSDLQDKILKTLSKRGVRASFNGSLALEKLCWQRHRLRGLHQRRTIILFIC